MAKKAKRPVSPKRRRPHPDSPGPGRRRPGPPEHPARPASPAKAPPGAARPPRAATSRPAGAASTVAGASLALAGLTVLAYCRVLFFGETFVERDALRFALPSREFLAHALRAGRIPEWLDAVGLGAPFAANPVHEMLAPLGWALALVPTSFGFDLYNLLHVLIGALGVAALSRRLGAGTAGSVVAGASLALGGYVTSMVPNNLAPALAWTPWVAWAADRLGCSFAPGEHSPAGASALAEPPAAVRRRRLVAGAGLAAALALQLLAGEPGSVLIAGLLAAILLVVRAGRAGSAGSPGGQLRAIGALAIAAAGALLLAAVALLPALLLLRNSARGAGLEGGLEWSLLPARLVETIWPAAFGSQRVDGWLAGLVLRDGPGDPCWSFSLFLGQPVLLCAWVAARQRHIRRLLLASLVFLLLAVGPLLPVYAMVRAVFPPLRWVNFPEKFVYGTLLLWSAGAGAGFSRLAEAGAEGAGRRLRLASWAGAAVLALGVAWLALSRPAAAAALAQRAAAWGVLLNADAGLGAALQGGCVAAAAAGLFALALTVARKWPRGARGMAFLALIGPLPWAAATTTPLAQRSAIEQTPAVLRGLSPAAPAAPASLPAGPRPRLFRLEPRRQNGPFHGGEEIAREYHESLDTNIASRFGLDVLPGFEPGESTRFLRFGREIFPRMSAVAFTRLLGVDWVVVRDPEALGLPFPVVARGASGYALLAAGPVRPRAFVAPRWRPAATPDLALESLANPEREGDPALVTLLDPGLGTSRAEAPLSTCGARQPRPEEVLLDCDSPAGGYAVLLDEWAPGWSAAADGRPAPIVLADGLFRAVAIGPGPHRIVFRYRTPGLRAGATVSLLSWLALATWLLAGWAPRRRQLRAPAGQSPTAPVRARQPAIPSGIPPGDG
jgi:hypothetical protein